MPIKNVCSRILCDRLYTLQLFLFWFHLVLLGFLELLPHPDKTNSSILLGHPNSVQRQQDCILNRGISIFVVRSHIDCSQYWIHWIAKKRQTEVYPYRFAIACWCSRADSGQSAICLCWRKLEWWKFIVCAWKKKAEKLKTKKKIHECLWNPQWVFKSILHCSLQRSAVTVKP